MKAIHAKTCSEFENFLKSKRLFKKVLKSKIQCCIWDGVPVTFASTAVCPSTAAGTCLRSGAWLATSRCAFRHIHGTISQKPPFLFRNKKCWGRKESALCCYTILVFWVSKVILCSVVQITLPARCDYKFRHTRCNESRNTKSFLVFPVPTFENSSVHF
jgi:hypothetical protein